MCAILCDGAIQIREDVAVVKNPVACTQYPSEGGIECQTDTWTEIIGVLVENCGQALEVITHPEINGHMRQKR